AMEEIISHNSYDKSKVFTPNVLDQYDVVEFGTLKGNGFFKENGYAVIRKDIDNNGIEKYYLVAIPDNQDVADYTFKLTADGDSLSPIWTINNRTITLPAQPGNHEFEGVIDNATYFRYSSNYLNWIYFGDYSGNGGDLPSITRFYQAKKALMTVGKLIANQAKIAIYNFTATTSGASNVQPLGMVALEPLASQPIGNSLDPNYINNINNMGTVIYSPLAEGLATVGGFFGNPSSHIVESYCHENFIIVISPGKSSEDLSVAAKSSPSSLSDFDNDDGPEGIVEGYVKENENIHMIPIGQNGSTYLDDVAYYLYNNDIVDYQDGFQNIRTYTIGFMGDFLSNLFLINTSNNGNGNTNLYDTDHEEYGKYHFETNDPNNLADTIFSAIIDIISQTSSFTAPVVPVTRTTSGNRIYMAFFKPNEGIFWEGNVVKFGIADDNTIVDINGDPATWPNGAIREDAQPYWRIKDWADLSKPNYIHNASRRIFTYLGANPDLTDPADESNQFVAGNSDITAEILRWPTHSVAEIINFVRGADVVDEDEDGDTTENRAIITGDVLHSEPLVVRYNYPDYTSKTYVYFGTNDGMLHAVKDVVDPNVDVDGDETNYGTEEWAFIPPDQLQRLKDMVEGNGHQYYIDSSPKAYFKDINNNGMLDDVNNDGVMDSNDDQIILICGERRGGSSYFALDVTVPDKPKYMWRIGSGNENTIIKYDGKTLTFGVNNWVGNLTTEMYNDWLYGDKTTVAPFVWGQIVSSIATGAQEGILELANIRRHAGGSYQNDETLTLWNGGSGWENSAMVMGDELAPDVIIPELGESWSEPQFGVVKTTDSDTDGTVVFFIGGGYSESNSSGRAVLAVNVFTGEVVRKFTDITTYTTDYEHTTDTNMYYSVPSAVKVIDEDG
ncbi:MAG: PilC/PilY family type IV pilus protein, partial [Desulfobacterales bacterium]